MKFAKDVISKKMTDNIEIAKLFALTHMKNAPANHLIKPWELNDQIARDIQGTIDQTDGEIKIKRDNNSDPKRFLHPRDLRERILSPFEKGGLLSHLDDAKKIKYKQQGIPRPGKKRSLGYTETYNEMGGKPSAYMATETLEKVKQIMEKDAAVDYFYKRLLRSKEAYGICKFNLLAFLYASKMDKRIIHRTAGLGASFFQFKDKQKYVDNFKVTFEILQTFSDKQMEQYADKLIDQVSKQGYFAALFALGMFTGGLFPS